ncbi:MAG: hypothetical protein KDH97_13875 [Calditrichaeota bacterium]|nr:hypothetical protein [Calditrichota bacterium]MCB0293980.1 hypothetical protein [Calditrichota bacterium]MCB0304846.1 hypothetical protein [Calditrichota bacterium]
MFKRVEIKLSLDKLKFHKRGSRWGKASPYIWNVFFKVDNESVMITDRFELVGEGQFKLVPGHQGNLGIDNMHERTSLHIPESIGEWHTPLIPFKLPIFESHFPAMAGMLTVLLLQGNVSGKGVEAGHQQLCTLVQNAVNQSIREFDPRKLHLLHVEKSIRAYFEHRVLKFAGEIVGSVESAVRNAQSVLQNIWSLAHKDDLVGYHIWDFSHADIDRHKGVIKFSQRWQHPRMGDWEIFGSLRTVKSPPHKVIHAAGQKKSRSPLKRQLQTEAPIRDEES